jgi:hypothetical protein
MFEDISTYFLYFYYFYISIRSVSLQSITMKFNAFKCDGDCHLKHLLSKFHISMLIFENPHLFVNYILSLHFTNKI